MEDKKEKILSVAVKLFVQNGFHGTPTSTIAKEAGVANGTLFHYFKTKEDLINTLYLEIKREFIRNSLSGLELETSFKNMIKRLCYQTINWALDYNEKYRFIKQFSNSPYINQLTMEEVNENIGYFHDFIKKGIDEDIIKNIPIDLVYQVSSFHLDAIIFYLYENQELAKNNIFMELVFDLYWDMIRKR